MAAFLLLGVLLDQLLGEPRRWHPLVGFGRLARAAEQRLYGDSYAWGIAALLLVVVPWVALAAVLARAGLFGPVFSILALYSALGLRSLREHALPVAEALEQADLPAARAAVGHMVSRDTAALNENQVAAAAAESVLENGNDAVFGALFWFALAGAPGVIAYRLVNTLDAMWGYRNARYTRFGWAAARLDDVLNFVPARLAALAYALCGNARQALTCWQQQAPQWDSPNAGPVMAAGAGALDVTLGGAAPYEGEWHQRPVLGCGPPPDAHAIRRALHLLYRAVGLWLLAAFLIGSLVNA